MERYATELDIPPSVADDARGWEILRAWQDGDGAAHVSLRTAREDPRAWGPILGDLARHIANAYERHGIMSQAQALGLIRQMIEAEWRHPTSPATGGLLG